MSPKTSPAAKLNIKFLRISIFEITDGFTLRAILFKYKSLYSIILFLISVKFETVSFALSNFIFILGGIYPVR